MPSQLDTLLELEIDHETHHRVGGAGIRSDR
jgi:hypothetical protein